MLDKALDLVAKHTVLISKDGAVLADKMSQETGWPMSYCMAIVSKAFLGAGYIGMKAVLNKVGEGDQLRSIVEGVMENIDEMIEKGRGNPEWN